MIECLEGSTEHFGGREDDWLHGPAAGPQPFHQPRLLEVRKHELASRAIPKVESTHLCLIIIEDSGK